MKKKVVLGMSGGVDSAVGLYLLLQNPEYEVIPVFMKNWDDTDDVNQTCSAENDFQDAKAVCDQLGIEIIKVNFEKEYWNKVFKYFLQEYKIGRTPNPDIMCNKEIKFKTFLNYAIDNLGADFVATGHYAQIKTDEHNNNYLVRGNDDNKDQTYFLAQINPNVLSKLIFPVGHLNKKQVREIASKANLYVKDKKDSTGICFIGEQQKFRNFLKGFLGAKPGNIVDVNNNIVGKHQGLMYYTLGQRRGLGIGGNSTNSLPWFVCGKNMKNNTLIVTQGENSIELFSNKLSAIDVNLFTPLKSNHNYSVKFRYRQVDVPCSVRIENNEMIVTYEKFSAVTPGQAVVIYDQEICVGSAIIDKIYIDDVLKKNV